MAVNQLLRRIIVSLLLAAHAGLASAGLPSAGTANEKLSNFSLEIEHSETEWRYQAPASDLLTTRRTLLGVQIQEMLAPRLRGSLAGGLLDLSQPGNPLAAARVTTGYYGQFTLSLLVLDAARLKLALSGGYRYQASEGYAEDIDVRLVWYDNFAELELGLKLVPQLDLRLSGGLNRSRGEQRSSGAQTAVLSFEEQSRSYYNAGLDYWLDANGYIHLAWLGGNRDGFRISFHRGF